eukprot:scaffold1984_cov99-Cylindrotheca_fusiformis.AAC.4
MIPLESACVTGDNNVIEDLGRWHSKRSEIISQFGDASAEQVILSSNGLLQEQQFSPRKTELRVRWLKSSTKWSTHSVDGRIIQWKSDSKVRKPRRSGKHFQYTERHCSWISKNCTEG